MISGTSRLPQFTTYILLTFNLSSSDDKDKYLTVVGTCIIKFINMKCMYLPAALYGSAADEMGGA